MEMILFLDTETTGLGSTARICQIAMDFCKDDGTTIATVNTLVNPEIPIHPKAMEVHGITDEMAANGVPLHIAQKLYERFLTDSSILIGHNIKFDVEMCTNSFKFPYPLWGPQTFCTMQKSTDICKVPGNYGKFKWPKLTEAHRHFFNEEFENAHDAMADVQACKRIYFKLKELGL